MNNAEVNFNRETKKIETPNNVKSKGLSGIVSQIYKMPKECEGSVAASSDVIANGSDSYSKITPKADGVLSSSDVIANGSDSYSKITSKADGVLSSKDVIANDSKNNAPNDLASKANIVEGAMKSAYNDSNAPNDLASKANIVEGKVVNQSNDNASSGVAAQELKKQAINENKAIELHNLQKIN